MSFGEMLFLVLLALIVFGPKRLPEIARKVGKIVGEFRRASNEFRAQIEDEVRKLELDEAVKSMNVELKQVSQSVSRMPLDQQILPPQSTRDVAQEVQVDRSFDAGFDTHNTAAETTRPEPAAEDGHSTHA
jgi:Tat protein translocase TatB subunit